MTFTQFDNHGQINPEDLTNEQLIQGHRELMECFVNTSLWQELDQELNYRVEELGIIPWPYDENPY